MAKKKSKKGKFEDRLKAALKGATTSEKLLTPHDYDLWSLTYTEGKYMWVKIMGSDGLLLSSRKTAKSETKAGSERQILVGVVIQCEQSTSHTKPNPFGKASISQVPFGVWVDVKSSKGAVSRQRLDVVRVALVAPEPREYKAKKKFQTIERNLEGVAALLVDTEILPIAQGAGAQLIERELMTRFRGFLKGPGNPHRSTKQPREKS